MEKPETNSDKLARMIRDLEMQLEIEKENFGKANRELLESLKPANIARGAFEKIKESPKFRGRAIGVLLGLGAAMIAKRIISRRLRRPHNRYERERIYTASHIAEPLGRILKPLLTLIATRILTRKQKSEEHQHA